MLNILYEDEHLLVIDKPADVLLVSGRAADNKDSIQPRAQALYSQALIAHRVRSSTAPTHSWPSESPLPEGF